MFGQGIYIQEAMAYSLALINRVSVSDVVFNVLREDSESATVIAQMSMSRSGNESVFDHVQNNVKHTLG